MQATGQARVVLAHDGLLTDHAGAVIDRPLSIVGLGGQLDFDIVKMALAVTGFYIQYRGLLLKPIFLAQGILDLQLADARVTFAPQYRIEQPRQGRGALLIAEDDPEEQGDVLHLPASILAILVVRPPAWRCLKWSPFPQGQKVFQAVCAKRFSEYMRPVQILFSGGSCR